MAQKCNLVTCLHFLMLQLYFQVQVTQFPFLLTYSTYWLCIVNTRTLTKHVNHLFSNTFWATFVCGNKLDMCGIPAIAIYTHNLEF